MPGTGREPTARELRSEVSRALGLLDEPQDWGIVNANPERLEEFVAFLEAQDLAPTQVFDMLELILASANERLVDDASADLPGLRAVLDHYPDAAKVHYDYWAGLDDSTEFPLSVWLRGTE